MSEGAVVSKWFINMLLALLIYAKGQRPQAYEKMQVPNLAQLRDTEESASRKDYFEVETRHEKTFRSLNIPNIILSGCLLKYIKFYVELMRPIIVEQTQVVESDAHNRPLLMHTKRVRIRHFARNHFHSESFFSVTIPEARNVTMMILRPSHAT